MHSTSVLQYLPFLTLMNTGETKKNGRKMYLLDVPVVAVAALTDVLHFSIHQWAIQYLFRVLAEVYLFRSQVAAANPENYVAPGTQWKLKLKTKKEITQLMALHIIFNFLH